MTEGAGEGPDPPLGASGAPSDLPAAAALRRPPWSEFRAELEAAGFRPSRGRGQNFLLDTNMAHAIARDAPFETGDFVLEIGPGCGFLSVPLVARGAKLCAIEVEPRLAEIARKFLADAPDAKVVVADALASKHALSPQLLDEIPREAPWHVVSNLPYSISGPVLALLTSLESPPQSVTVLVQLEVAQRLCAEPGDATYGALSPRVQRRYRAELGRRVPAGLFWPRPRVESAIAKLVLDPSKVQMAPQAAYDRVVGELFQQRRKAIRGALGRLAGSREVADAWLAARDWDPQLRPESLDVGAFEAIAEAFG